MRQAFNLVSGSEGSLRDGGSDKGPNSLGQKPTYVFPAALVAGRYSRQEEQQKEFEWKRRVTGSSNQLAWALILATVYIALLYGLYVPDWEYQIPIAGSLPKTLSVKCGVRGDTGPACDAVGMIDRQIFGIQHLHRRPVDERTRQYSINSLASGLVPPDAPSWCQAPFDPEGLLSTVMAIITCLIGLQLGHAIVHFKGHGGRILHWMIVSFYLLALVLCHYVSSM